MFSQPSDTSIFAAISGQLGLTAIFIKLKEARVTPIHKGWHQGLAANYRPVALTSHKIKVYKFNDGQHDFRMGRSGSSKRLIHHDRIVDILEQSLPSLCSQIANLC